MYKLNFWLFLIQFLSPVFTGPTEGKATNTNISNGSWMGPKLHGVVLVLVLRRSVVCWAAHQESLTSPITWTCRALNILLGNIQPRLRWPGLQSSSTMQVINIRIVSVTTSRNRLDIFINLSISKGLQCVLTAITIVALWQLPH